MDPDSHLDIPAGFGVAIKNATVIRQALNHLDNTIASRDYRLELAGAGFSFHKSVLNDHLEGYANRFIQDCREKAADNVKAANNSGLSSRVMVAFERLGLDPKNADQITQKDIRNAYHARSLEIHPDKVESRCIQEKVSDDERKSAMVDAHVQFTKMLTAFEYLETQTGIFPPQE